MLILGSGFVLCSGAESARANLGRLLSYFDLDEFRRVYGFDADAGALGTLDLEIHCSRELTKESTWGDYVGRRPARFVDCVTTGWSNLKIVIIDFSHLRV